MPWRHWRLARHLRHRIGGLRTGSVSAHRSVLFAVSVAGGGPVRTPTPSTAAGQGFQLAARCGGQAAGRSPARMPATSITNTAITAPDKNAAITSVTVAEVISLRRFRRLIWRCGHEVSPFPWVPENLVTATVGPGKGETNNTVR